MCPITLPDSEAEWMRAAEELAEAGVGAFCALDIQDWIDFKRVIGEQIERWSGVLEYLRDC